MSLAKMVLPSLSATAIGTWAFNKFFNRDPTRYINPSGAVSACDGKVHYVSGNEVKTVLRIHDVHIIRSPLPGTIESITLIPGGTDPCINKCPSTNRYKKITISTPHGNMYVSLIHGAITKRIDIFVNQGDIIEKGTRLGHIHLGSGCDVVLPPGYTPTVKVGDLIYAGASVIATYQLR